MAKKTGLTKYLDSLVGEDGLQTEITITLTDKTMTKLTTYLTLTVILSSVAYFTIRGLAQSMTSKKTT